MSVLKQKPPEEAKAAHPLCGRCVRCRQRQKGKKRKANRSNRSDIARLLKRIQSWLCVDIVILLPAQTIGRVKVFVICNGNEILFGRVKHGSVAALAGQSVSPGGRRVRPRTRQKLSRSRVSGRGRDVV